MSRIGKIPIDVPSGIDVTVAGSSVTTKGPRGELSLEVPETIKVELSDGVLTVVSHDETRRGGGFHGLYRCLISNMVEGVEKGFSRALQIEGVGFRAETRGTMLVLNLGFSSPIEYQIPDTVAVTVENNTRIVVSGADKQQVGMVAARIRGFAPAEPYKGKGISYEGERVRRKVGKTVA